MRSAVEVALHVSASIKKGGKRAGIIATLAKVNFDRQIAAIAKVEGCHTLYTDDTDLGKIAIQMGLKAVTLAGLPLPPSKIPLLENIEAPPFMLGDGDDE